MLSRLKLSDAPLAAAALAQTSGGLHLGGMSHNRFDADAIFQTNSRYAAAGTTFDA